MTKRLSDLWIFSDIDGTIVEAPYPIPPRNLEALRRFIKAGGHFAVATGRSVDSALQYVQDLPVNVPCIILNGAAIYDFSAKRICYAKYLPDTWSGHVKAAIERFPDAGVTLLNERLYISVAKHDYVQRYLVDADHVVPTKGRIADCTEALIKIIVVVQEQDAPALQGFLAARTAGEMTVVRSSPYFIELLPPETDKGTCLREYSRLNGISMENIIAIGDYYNDEAMLRAAGYPVTVEGAPDEVKKLCRRTVGSCMGGALADLVEHLEQLCAERL